MNPSFHEVIIVGSGFAGLAMAVKLKKAGIKDFVILEKAQEVGGTWRDNHYPGAECDVPSPLYSFSFAPNPHWSQLFAGQKEIYEYLKDCAKKFEIYPHIRFQSLVQKAQFDEEFGQWHLDVAGQGQLHCRYMVLCTGGLSIPSYPQIPGLSDFKGKLFHTARWDHDVSLKGKRVGVIGTGASAIQVVPEISDTVGQLAVFQRSAAWVAKKPNKSFQDLTKTLFRVFPWLQRLLRFYLYGTAELRALGLFYPRLIKLISRLLLKHMKNEVNDDEELFQKLRPDYVMGCKRILLSNDYYKTFTKDHVEVITKAIESIKDHGVQCEDGHFYELDALICATGFKVSEDALPFPVFGLKGESLEELWRDGPEAYLGVVMHGFPNAFMIVGPNSGLGHNSIVFIIESQVRYVVKAIKKWRTKPHYMVQVKKKVQKDYNRSLVKRFEGTVWSAGNCQSWYRTESGRIIALWPGFSFELALRTAICRSHDYEFLPIFGALQEEAGARQSLASLDQPYPSKGVTDAS